MKFDKDKCIGCGQCVRTCPVSYLSLQDKKVSCTGQKCIECGQCSLVCPVQAIEAEPAKIDLSRKIHVAQIAPAVRASIGEEFGYEPGSIMTEQLVAGLKKLGFHYVFDVAVGADFTTVEEAKELEERILKNQLPVYSSCCPAWVSFAHEFHPELVSSICTTRPPHIILGGLVKYCWSQEHDLKPEDIVVTSIMPCTAKKEEIKRFKVDDWFPVDHVVTVRELAKMFQENNIGLEESEPADNPFGDPSGAGVIYGYSGGVFESALRTANLPREIKATNVSGLKNISFNGYEAMEVMACPGGCVGGGGQPFKGCTTKRTEALKKIDAHKAVKKAHENPTVKYIYEKYLVTPEIRKKLLH